MLLNTKWFGPGKSKNTQRSPRYEYLSYSSVMLDDQKLNITVKNISLSGVLIEFLNKDRELVRKTIEKERSYRIAIPYKSVLVPEQVIVARIDAFCGSIICGCRFDNQNTDYEIVQKRERFITSLLKN